MRTRGWVMTVVPPMFVHQLPDWLQPIQRDPDVQAMAEAWQKEYDQQLDQAVEDLKKFQADAARDLPRHRADRRPRPSGRADSGDDRAAEDRSGDRRQPRSRRGRAAAGGQHVGAGRQRSAVLGADRAVGTSGFQLKRSQCQPGMANLRSLLRNARPTVGVALDLLPRDRLRGRLGTAVL